MNRWIVTGVAALFFAACTRESSTRIDIGAPAAAVATDATVVLELGRDICQGCVDGAQRKLQGVAGIGAMSLNPGGKDFTLHYDSKKVQPADIVAKLKAAGEEGAKVKS